METISVYSIDELSNEAKARAHSDFMGGGFEYFWLDEGIESIKAFCEQFGCKVTDYTIGTCGHSYIKTNADNSTFRGIGAKFKIAEFPTGYCIDEALRIAYLAEFERTHSAKLAFNAAIDAALKAIISDMEYQETMEYFLEHAEANEYKFLGNGRMI